MAHTPPAQTLVQIGLSTSRLQHGLRRLLWQAVMITLSTLAGGLCIAVFLARRITIPLQGLTLAATKLAGGEAVPPWIYGPAMRSARSRSLQQHGREVACSRAGVT